MDITSPPMEVRSIAISVYVCMSVCPLTYLKNHAIKPITLRVHLCLQYYGCDLARRAVSRSICYITACVAYVFLIDPCLLPAYKPPRLNGCIYENRITKKPLAYC